MASNSSRVSVPTGRLIASTNWTNTTLSSFMKARNLEVNFCEDLGVHDFLPSNDAAVIFVTEGDLLSDQPGCKRRLVKFCNVDKSLRKIVIIQKTPLTAKLFGEFQKLCVIDLGLTIIPVRSEEEAASLLKQMVNCESKRYGNPFRIQPKDESPDEAVLKTIQTVSGFGDKKALAALDKFSTLSNIVNASKEEMSQVVGSNAASKAYDFFNNKF